jgi:hypothetical protein
MTVELSVILATDRFETIRKTVESLRAKADLLDPDPPTITDPLFELWLRRRGLAGLGPGEDL